MEALCFCVFVFLCVCVFQFFFAFHWKWKSRFSFSRENIFFQSKKSFQKKVQKKRRWLSVFFFVFFFSDFSKSQKKEVCFLFLKKLFLVCLFVFFCAFCVQSASVHRYAKRSKANQRKKKKKVFSFGSVIAFPSSNRRKASKKEKPNFLKIHKTAKNFKFNKYQIQKKFWTFLRKSNVLKLKKSSEFFYEKKKRVYPWFFWFFVEHLVFPSFFAFWKTKEVFSKNFFQKKYTFKKTNKQRRVRAKSFFTRVFSKKNHQALFLSFCALFDFSFFFFAFFIKKKRRKTKSQKKNACKFKWLKKRTSISLKVS